jgi:Flp pilus assembly protein TadG
MKRIARLLRISKRRDLVRDQSGLAAVEFALISTAMFAMLSGAVDLTQAITIRRDLNRLTAEIAESIAISCKGASGCSISAMDAIRARQANIAPKLATVQLGMATFLKKNNRADDIVGTMTYLPTDMNTDAMARMQEGDRGVAVLATYTHTPIILGLADDWGFTTKNFRSARVVLSSRS